MVQYSSSTILLLLALGNLLFRTLFHHQNFFFELPATGTAGVLANVTVIPFLRFHTIPPISYHTSDYITFLQFHTMLEFF